MKTELVKTLLKAGVVTEAQVERATNYRFGTGLVERLLCLGYGSEDDVFKIIKNNLKLAVIEGRELENISQEALSSVPRDMIERNHFLPFYADETKIHIAFFDPTKDSCMHEVQFFTSKKIIPFGVRANVLAKSLNRYFDLKIPEEFKFGKEQVSNPDLAPPPLVEDKSKTFAKPTLPPIPSVKEAPKPPLPKTPTAPVMQELLEEKTEGFKFDTASFSDDEDSFSDFRDIVDVEKTPFEPIADVVVEPVLADAGSQSVYVDTDPIDIAVNKEQIIEAVNTELKKVSERSELFFVRNEDLVTIDGSGITIPLSVPSFFKDVFDSGKRFYGIPPRSYVADEFFNKLGGALPGIICVVPVSIENQVFAIVYAEGVDNPMHVEEIAEKTAQAFDRLLS